MPLMSTDGIKIGYVEKDPLSSTSEKMRMRFIRAKGMQWLLLLVQFALGNASRTLLYKVLKLLEV
ncbi:hypothetical protein [uncultured Microbulbifer sp.]|uniref:hypothetical protein n=1 Tax=uncultured Microbulbifer sp. TaxID=348147 RepID=UPI00260E3D71|nr:hypothetical protein [uncultured Microbulbifer sp.]